jgi:GTPase KRas protein
MQRQDMGLSNSIFGTEGREVARQFGCPFFEASAKLRINVDEAFTSLVREIRLVNRVRR